MEIPQLNWIRKLSIDGVPDFGARLFKAMRGIQTQVTNIERQGNFSAQAQPAAPPAIQGVHVSTGPGGEFQIAISDTGQVNRGINYFVEHDSDPNFSNPHVIDMGQSRNHSVYMGGQTLHWRAYSAYPGSDASPAAYHGSAADPLPVQGGVAGARAPSQGSGTGAPAQGLVGPGPVPARTDTSGFNWNAQEAPNNE